MTRSCLLCTLFALLASALLWEPVSTAVGADWPQWQGPNRDATSEEQGLLQTWPTGGPPLVRKISGRGGGDGTPSIANGRIFGMGHRDNKEVVWALSEKD